MISRTLGPEFGGSIGLMFYLANVCACGVYVLGLVEAILDVFGAGGLQPQSPGAWGGERGQLSVLFCSGRGCESAPEPPLSLLLLAQMDRSRRA